VDKLQNFAQISVIPKSIRTEATKSCIPTCKYTHLLSSNFTQHKLFSLQWCFKSKSF